MRKKKSRYGEAESALRTFVVFTRAYRQMNQQDVHHIQSSGLTHAQFAVLEVLYHKGDLRISEVMKKILGTHGNMTLIVQNLKKEGYILHYRCPKDARASIIGLTEKGRSLMNDFFPKHAAFLKDLFSPLNDEEKEELIRLMKKLSGLD